MKTTLKINLDAVLERIYAESAWRAAHRDDVYTLNANGQGRDGAQRTTRTHVGICHRMELQPQLA